MERDVRQVLSVTDLLASQTFLGLAASRTGQLLNLSQLGGDAGVSHNTARSWLGVLGVEAKSGATVPTEAFGPLRAVAELVPELRERLVVHGPRARP